ncbi:zf-TFIIB domain-containing protein [Paenibacillus thailandensis]|uniref:Zf-TFIIB domain-containing protein n=1 Tax=Paenibacillus thailandensis TaxID=393250 RepID=A0ABW5R189_9BACL
MQCPVCIDSRMREVEKNGILIDICPSCKGVWLDRGELDKLMNNVREVRDEYNEWHYKRQETGYFQSTPSNRPGGYPNYPPSSGGHSGHGQHGYPSGGGYGRDKHYSGSHGHPGYPYKKKKSVIDLFGDLFD